MPDLPEYKAPEDSDISIELQFPIGGAEVSKSCSIGVACFGCSVCCLLKLAVGLSSFPASHSTS